MKSINFLIISIFCISKILLQSNPYLTKYGKLTSVTDSFVIFDSSDFKVKDDIYIIITGTFDAGSC